MIDHIFYEKQEIRLKIKKKKKNNNKKQHKKTITKKTKQKKQRKKQQQQKTTKKKKPKKKKKKPTTTKKNKKKNILLPFSFDLLKTEDLQVALSMQKASVLRLFKIAIISPLCIQMLTLRMLGKNSSDGILKYFLYFAENGL